MALLYPVVTLVEDENWSLNQYEFEPEDALVSRTIQSIKKCMPLINELYVRDDTPLHHMELSPLYVDDLSQFPKTLIVSAEYDYLRVQDELYVKRLADAQVDVRYVQYKGMGALAESKANHPQLLGKDHAFLDKCGVYPQAEDCMNEIVKDLECL